MVPSSDLFHGRAVEHVEDLEPVAGGGVVAYDALELGRRVLAHRREPQRRLGVAVAPQQLHGRLAVEGVAVLLHQLEDLRNSNTRLRRV